MSLQSDLISQLLQLSPGERAELARELILSLEPEEFDTDVETAWEAEIERRLSAVDEGTVKLLDWRKSVEKLCREEAPG